MKLKDKVTVITGGVQGIGLAYARRFVKEGSVVVLGDIQDAKGKAAVAELERLGGRAAYAHCDVTKKAEVEALFAGALKSYGRVDACIANAGIVHDAGFLELEEKDFDRVMAVNVKGVFLTGQSAARAMIAGKRGGVIINIASTNAVVVQHGQVTYPVSKGAVNLLTRVMAISLADHGIRVVAIGPGPTRTEMLDNVMKNHPSFQRNIGLRTPLRRPAEAEEIAGVAAFLASDDASYITGQTIYAEGGRLILNYMMPEKE
jgi:NAD(P)-dependent dehydrogenase (short-subunit alcohol dehydrogenase family)